MTDLKQCPFCAGDADLQRSWSSKHQAYFVYVRCDICHIRGKSFRCLSDPQDNGFTDEASQRARKAWNMRHGEDDLSLMESSDY